jgi:hypothetical protein
LVLALALSGLTYTLVENPFRRARALAARPRQSLLLYPVAVALTLAVCFGANAQIQSEAAVRANVAAISTSNFGDDDTGVVKHFSRDPQLALVEASALAARNHQPIPGVLSPSILDLGDDKADVGDCDYAVTVRRLCERGAVGSTRSIVLFGDSHARHWIPAVEKIAEDNGLSAYFLVKPGCSAAQMKGWAGDKSFLADCLSWRAWAVEQIEQLQPSVLLIGGDVPDEVLDGSGDVVEDDTTVTDMYSAGLKDTITMVNHAVGRIFVLGDPPGLDERPVDCLAGRGNDLGDCAGKPDARDGMEIAAAESAATSTGATFVPTRQWFCYEGICPAVVGSTITFWDRNHITKEYALQLAPALDAKLGL